MTQRQLDREKTVNQLSGWGLNGDSLVQFLGGLMGNGLMGCWRAGDGLGFGDRQGATRL